MNVNAHYPLELHPPRGASVSLAQASTRSIPSAFNQNSKLKIRKFLWVLCALLLWRSLAPAAGSPLADAVEKQHRAKVHSLLEQHADVKASQADGMTALHWAAYLDEFEIAKRLLAAGADARATNRYGVAPLSLACLNGNRELVES